MIRTVFLLGQLLTFTTSLLAFQNDEIQLLFFVNESTDSLSLSSSIEYFIDDNDFIDGNDSLEYEHVKNQNFNIDSIVPMLGSRDALWFRFSILNTSNKVLNRFLCDRPYESKTYFYRDSIFNLGKLIWNKDRWNKFCHKLILAPFDTLDIYARHSNLIDANSKSTQMILLNRKRSESYVGSLIQSKYYLTARISNFLYLFMFAVSFMFSLFFRQRFIWFYSAYLLLIFVFYNGISFLIPLNDFTDKYLSFFIFPCYLFFVKYILDTPTFYHRLDTLLDRTAYVCLACFPLFTSLHLLGSIKMAYSLWNLCGVIMFFMIFCILYVLLRYIRTGIAYIICLGTAFIFIPMFSTLLAHLFDFTTKGEYGYILKELNTPWGFSYYMMHSRIGVVIEMLFFAVAVALLLKKRIEETAAIKAENEKLRIVSNDILGRKQLANSQFSAQLIDYIQQHKSDTIRIDDLSKRFGLGRTSLIETIKHETDMTPNQFVTFTKLSFAKEELLTTTKSVKEVSNEFGFSSPAYFSSVFKAKFGVSPKTMRTNH